MIDYIKGEISELLPAYVVLETGGIGYLIHIPLTVYTALGESKTTKLLVYEVLREDTHTLYGFLSKAERELFLLLISVSGIGANTARVIMSSYSAVEIQQMIANNNVAALNAIKGIGTKTAQRIIVDLKDKILKIENFDEMGGNTSIPTTENSVKKETLAALQMLGYSVVASSRVIDKILAKSPTLRVEELIKNALKML